MFTIIGGDRKEYGPASAEQIRGWIASGRANLDTKAKAVGSDEWRRLGDYPEFLNPPPLGDPAAATTSTSTATRSPLPVTGPVDAKTFAANLIARAAPLDVFSCLSRGFELWKSNFFPLVGVTLLVVVIQVAAGMVPVLGVLAGLLLNGIFYGGLYYYYLGKMRGEPRSVGDAFAGFRICPGSLIGANVLITVLTMALALVFFGPWLLSFIREAIAAGDTAVMPTPPTGAALLGMLAGIAAALYVTVAWLFTFPLIVDRRLGAWTAMSVSLRVVSKQWFRVFFLMVLAAILTMLGLIAFIIGVLLTMPIMFAALLYAYEDLCNPPGSAEVSVTPTFHAS